MSCASTQSTKATHGSKRRGLSSELGGKRHHEIKKENKIQPPQKLKIHYHPPTCTYHPRLGGTLLLGEIVVRLTSVTEKNGTHYTQSPPLHHSHRSTISRKRKKKKNPTTKPTTTPRSSHSESRARKKARRKKGRHKQLRKRQKRRQGKEEEDEEEGGGGQKSFRNKEHSAPPEPGLRREINTNPKNAHTEKRHSAAAAPGKSWSP